MDEPQVPNDKPKGCGCGNAITTTKITYGQRTPLTEQQEQLVARIQKANQRKNSIYKTKTRYFM